MDYGHYYLPEIAIDVWSNRKVGEKPQSNSQPSTHRVAGDLIYFAIVPALFAATLP